ncbi:MAG: PilN domain-containing protein [Candidatus Omnitrophota bacterium]
MPQINLLSPVSKKKITRKAIALELPKVDVFSLYPAVFSAVAPLFIILVLISLALFGFNLKKNNDLGKVTLKEQSLAVEPAELINLNQRKVALDKKIVLLAELSSQRFLWSAKLSDISDCLPAGVWLTDLVLSKKRTQQTSITSVADQKERLVLTIKGSAVAPQIDNAVAFIGEFVNTLKSRQSFAGDFSEIKLGAIYKATIGKSDVMNFELNCFVR